LTSIPRQSEALGESEPEAARTTTSFRADETSIAL